jgi:hypothetical protein
MSILTLTDSTTAARFSAQLTSGSEVRIHMDADGRLLDVALAAARSRGLRLEWSREDSDDIAYDIYRATSR